MNRYCAKRCTDKECPAGTACHHHDELGRPHYHEHPDHLRSVQP